MFETIKELISIIRWTDICDILIVSFIFYRILLFIKGTRSAQIIIGIIFIFILYQLSNTFGLLTLNWLLNSFLQSIILIIVILFQQDIRVALSRFGKNLLVKSSETVTDIGVIDEIVKACVSLSFKKIGALILIPRETGLKNLIEIGHEIDAIVSKELLETIFIPSTPLHDGAVLIEEGRIKAAGCFLPLSTNPEISKELGTRHRAAIGITEESDAVTVVVSEETGNISVSVNGKLTRNLDADTLKRVLKNLILQSKGTKQKAEK